MVNVNASSDVVYIRKVKKSESKSQPAFSLPLNIVSCVYP